jgi:N-terminal domain of toast_rack, DUF2154
MNANGSLLLAGALCFTGTWCLTGCGFRHGGPVPHDSQSFDLNNSEQLQVNLSMKAGILRIAGGTGKLAVADFTYSEPSWKPQTRYSSDGGFGNLTIRDPEHGGSVTANTWYEWDLRLNQEVPLNFDIHLGGGEAHLELGSLTLRHVNVQVGAGTLEVDLRGSPQASYQARIQNGGGETILRLPSGVGVDAKAEVNVGEITAPGLHHEGNHYFNDALTGAKVAIHLDIRGGVGPIRLISY